nr:integrase, catalytic region, zinc finger, CCHC-type, peptidase aspartic, catalytic [Tanacetum cinerariifolium]
CSKHMIGDRSRLRNFVRNFIEIVKFGNDHFGAIIGYSKHMTGDRSRLRNFVRNFIKTVKFENDHFGAIIGYGDYVVGDTVISRVKFLKSKDETPEFVIKFLKQMQVGLNKTVRCICTDNGTEFLTEYYENVRIFHQKSVSRTPCRMALSKDKTKLLHCLLHPKRFLIHTRHNKTPYELVHAKKPNLTFFYVFGALCYLTNDSEDLRKLQPTADFGIVVGYAPSRKGPAPTFLTPGKISSGLVPDPVPGAPYVPLSNKDLEMLFQPMFDEYLKPSRVKRPVSPTLAVPVPVNTVSTPSSTTIDYDAPYNLFAPVDHDPFINMFPLKPSSEASSSGDVSLAASTYVTQTHYHLEK